MDGAVWEKLVQRDQDCKLQGPQWKRLAAVSAQLAVYAGLSSGHYLKGRSDQVMYRADSNHHSSS